MHVHLDDMMGNWDASENYSTIPELNVLFIIASAMQNIFFNRAKHSNFTLKYPDIILHQYVILNVNFMHFPSASM